MKREIKIVFLLCCLQAWPVFSGDLTLQGGLTYNKRYASYFFDEIEKRVDKSRSNLLMPGFSAGFRYNQKDNNLRLELLYSFNAGADSDDTITTGNGKEEVVYSYRINSFDMQAHFIPDNRGKPSIFFLLRCGAGIMHVEEQVVYANMDAVDTRCFFPFVGAGIGFDFRLKRVNIGLEMPLINLSRPVYYEYARDMPLDSVYYREVFLYFDINLVLQILSKKS
ncbi:MAG: hypothetical protein ACOCSE_05245 [Chitinivibrionales bacterium]